MRSQKDSLWLSFWDLMCFYFCICVAPMELIILMIFPFYKAFVPTGLFFNPSHLRQGTAFVAKLLRRSRPSLDRRQAQGCFIIEY